MVSVYVSRWYVEGEEGKVGKKGGYEKLQPLLSYI